MTHRAGTLVSLLILALLLVTSPVAAQDDLWTAWLYDASAGRVTAINSDGEIVQRFVLPLPEGYTSYGAFIAVSPSQTLVAYQTIDAVSSPARKQMRVYEIASEHVIFSSDLLDGVLGTNLDFSPSRYIFDEARNTVALSTEYEVGLSGNDAPRTGWQITLWNYRTHEEPLTLGSGHPAIGEQTGVIPIIVHHYNKSATFLLVDTDETGVQDYPGYVWDGIENSVTPDENRRSPAGDEWRRWGEIIRPVYEPSLEAAYAEDALLPMSVSNAVEVWQPVYGERYLWYHTADTSIIRVNFVQNYGRVLVRTYDAEANQTGWTLLERDGTSIDQPPLEGMHGNVFNTLDGFVYLDRRDGGFALVEYLTRKDEFTERVFDVTDAGDLVDVFAQTQEEETYLPWNRSDLP